MSVSTLRPSCLTVTHSLWRGDLAMRSRAQGCDHSCAAAVCAATAIAMNVKRIAAERFMMHLVAGGLGNIMGIAGWRQGILYLTMEGTANKDADGHFRARGAVSGYRSKRDSSLRPE